MYGPDPNDPFPLPAHPRVGFLKPLVRHPFIEIGDFSYYDDPDGAWTFVEKCFLYHHPPMGDRLIVGRYCAFAAGLRFIMNGANHRLSGFSTYPFNIFGGAWEAACASVDSRSFSRGDTIVGNDVWIGTGATILPGVKIGDGAVVGASAVVGTDVAPYTIVIGNPARVIHTRFEPSTIAALRDIAWWNWSAGKVARNLTAICGADLDALRSAQADTRWGLPGSAVGAG